MNEPLVSIVILSALRKRCTRECLESIESTVRGISYEVIVVDMGFDRDIREWLEDIKERDARIKVIFNDENVGTSKGRNQGIGLAKGKYVCFLDNDIVTQQSWLTQLLGAAERWPHAGLFGAKLICMNDHVYFCDKYLFDEKTDYARRIGVRVVEPLRSDDPAVNCEGIVPWYPTGCLMVRREVLDQLKGFDEKLLFVEEDKDLCLRAGQIGWTVVYCPRSVVIHERIQDDVYDTQVRYNNIEQIDGDIRFFESKWKCKVDLIYSKKSLRDLGYSPQLIENMDKGRLNEFFTLV